jgi:membrane protease YdiL (CAAX protease family)
MVLFNVLGIVANRVLDLPTIWITIIAEIFIIALVPILFAVIGKYDFKATFSLKKIGWGTMLLCVLVGGITQFAVRFLGLLWQYFLQLLGPLKLPSQTDLAGTTFFSVLIFSLATIVLAPVCEEILCRGFILAGFNSSRFINAALMGGLIFGLFHQYPFRFVDTALAGIVLSYLVLTTGSIFAGIAAHFGFNLLPTVIVWFSEPINEFLQRNGISQRVGDSPSLDMDLVTGTLTISLVATALVFWLLQIITKMAVTRNKGVVLNYNGLATAKNETLTENQPDTFQSPGSPYLYGEYGYIMTPSEDKQPLATRYPPPQPVQKPVLPKSKLQALALILFVLILATFAFSSIAEIQLRLAGV